MVEADYRQVRRNVRLARCDRAAPAREERHGGVRALQKGTPPVHDVGRQRCRRRDAGRYGNAPMQATAEATAGPRVASLSGR